MMCCQHLVEYDSWIHLWYGFSKHTMQLPFLISNVLTWKQDSSRVQFLLVEVPSQVAPQPVGHASENIVSFGDSINMSCEHVKCLSHQHNSTLAVEVSFTIA